MNANAIEQSASHFETEVARARARLEYKLAQTEDSVPPTYACEETPSCYLFAIKAPNLSLDDLDVEVLDNGILITGEKREDSLLHSPKGIACYCELFQKGFAIEDPVDEEGIDVSEHEGVFTILVPKEIAV